jgi:uncharacterized membrane protein YdbT with pleckstrin-like domain
MSGFELDAEPEIVSRYLTEGERGVLQTRHHVVVLAKPLAIALGVFVAAGAAATQAPAAGGLLFLASLVVAGAAFADWWATVYIITDKRIIAISGIRPFNRRIASVSLRMLTNNVASQKTLGYLLGYGTIVIEDPGQDQAIEFMRYIPRPAYVNDVLSAQIYGTPSP